MKFNTDYVKSGIKQLSYTMGERNGNGGWYTTTCPYNMKCKTTKQVYILGSSFETNCEYCIIISVNPNIVFCSHKESKY